MGQKLNVSVLQQGRKKGFPAWLSEVSAMSGIYAAWRASASAPSFPRTPLCDDLRVIDAFWYKERCSWMLYILALRGHDIAICVCHVLPIWVGAVRAAYLWTSYSMLNFKLAMLNFIGICLLAGPYNTNKRVWKQRLLDGLPLILARYAYITNIYGVMANSPHHLCQHEVGHSFARWLASRLILGFVRITIFSVTGGPPVGCDDPKRPKAPD
eukprot:1151441-Pelagomonas_calceolata.AAC.8